MLKAMVMNLILKVMINFHVKLFVIQKNLNNYMQVFLIL